MDILNDHVVVYLKKNFSPAVLVHNISKKENKILSLQEIGELKPRLNKVYEFLYFLWTWIFKIYKYKNLWLDNFNNKLYY